MADNYQVKDAAAATLTFRAAEESSIKIPIVRSDSTGPQKLHLPRYLDTNGDGTGTKNANGNYSGGATDFYIQPPASTIYRIARLIVSVEDTSGFSAAEYGNTGSALSNVIHIETQDGGGTIVDYDNGVPIKTNAEWGRVCYDADLKTWGAGNELLLVRWTYTKSGSFIRLDGDSSEKFVVTLNDDLTGLISHYFLVQGYIE